MRRWTRPLMQTINTPSQIPLALWQLSIPLCVQHTKQRIGGLLRKMFTTSHLAQVAQHSLYLMTVRN